jgi:DNA polymerase-3 subunit delta
LRNLFEKKTNLGIIPCYQDNEITLRNLIKNELSDFKNLETNLINMIINYSNLNRKTIKNNLDKIKSFYDKRILSEDSLETLLNSDRNEMFENIRDAALSGDKLKLNDLLDNFVFSNEDVYQYLNMINYRFIKILNIHKQNESYNDLNVTISKMKPPVFWKDRPVYLKMLKKWDKQSVIEVLKYLAKVENKIKKNSSINSLTIIKNSITNICTNSWTYF